MGLEPTAVRLPFLSTRLQERLIVCPSNPKDFSILCPDISSYQFAALDKLIDLPHTDTQFPSHFINSHQITIHSELLYNNVSHLSPLYGNLSRESIRQYLL